MKNAYPCVAAALISLCLTAQTFAQEKQAVYFKTKKLIEALDFIGTPISENDKTEISKVIASDGPIMFIENILDKYAILSVQINPESRIKINEGAAKPYLVQNGWKTFLVKIENQAGITAKVEVVSPQAKRTYDRSEALTGLGNPMPDVAVTPADIKDRWLDVSLFTQNPMKENLSGIEVEYFILQLYSRDAGKKAATFSVNCGQGTQDIGLRNETNLLFECAPANKVQLEILDENNVPTTASITIKDKQGHIYPSQTKRLAPDFFFQTQIYRASGETLELPAGQYNIEFNRGPEYLSKSQILEVADNSNQKLKIQLRRWIDPSKMGWYSGDHHIHAAGCSHYTTPTEGVNPEDMFRHVVGEALNVGSVLTWGPCYYHQKQFFEGRTNGLSTGKNLIRYDLEISGFPSSHAGHLVLLRLKDQDYPNTKVLEDWPTYTIPILRWAKAQGAITGYPHSAFGLEVKNNALPNYDMPKFDGIGANEFIVAVTQNLVDFISTMDTAPTWELNIWYHTLNCGFRTRISGETDFPCMSDQKVGHGRSYVKMDKQLNFDEWAEGIRLGRTYTSEGKSHIMDFKVNNIEMGTKNSEVNIKKPSKVKISAKVSAYLNETINPDIKPMNVLEEIWSQRPFWDIEKGRIGNTRTVLLELVVNGEVAATRAMTADGTIQDVSFETEITKSSWVAMRIMPSSHTNPIFVIVDSKPVRVNKKSAEWCLKAVDVCWESKKGKISEKERGAAEKDYENAKNVYQKILSEM